MSGVDVEEMRARRVGTAPKVTLGKAMVAAAGAKSSASAEPEITWRSALEAETAEEVQEETAGLDDGAVSIQFAGDGSGGGAAVDCRARAVADAGNGSGDCARP